MPSSSAAQPLLGSVLVVGGCGFLGHHIVRFLQDDSDCGAVAVLDKNIERNRIAGVSYHQGDITSLESVRTILADVRPRVIIHSAAPVPHQTKVDPTVYTRGIIDGTANLIRCATENPAVEAFVYTSTCTVISGSEWHLADETHPLVHGRLPLDPYREAKAKADALVRQANQPPVDGTEGLRTACIRPGGIFGEGDYQVIPPILSALRRGQTKVQLGSNTTRFDMVYVENVADAHLLLAKALITGATAKVDGEAFFITNDDPYRYWDFLTAVWAAAGHRASPEERKNVWVIPNRVLLAMASTAEWLVWLTSLGRRRPQILARQLIEIVCVHKTFSVEKAKDRLGYVPRVSIDEGIRRGVEWAQREKAWETAWASTPVGLGTEPSQGEGIINRKTRSVQRLSDD